MAELLKKEVIDDLTGNILPYWLDRMQDSRGGFYGRRDGSDRLDDDAPKGAILNGRLLWTFSAAYRTTGRKEYLEAADRVLDYIMSHFIDREYGGVYWSLTADGMPLDTKKQFYAIGFVIYGLSEYVRATGDRKALDVAVDLYRCIETHSRDAAKGGYIEAMTRDWRPIDDMRLSDKDTNCSKTMNTHLHIIEPYTNLYRVWPDEGLRADIMHLMHIFLDIMEDSRTHHLGLFFDDDWNRIDANISYGHDIEASWLLLETAQVLGDESLLEKTLAHTRAIANAALEGRRDNGSMIYERVATPDGSVHIDGDLHWWVQAEDVIGLVYLYRFHGVEEALAKAFDSWTYIKDNLIDREGGEWHWSRRDDGSVNRDDDKAGFWKCPYHNSRMCMEVARVLSL
ncbi:MAG: AGE family epimerase/isomerase [Muribaculaceae bacterium]|nr:AGE family epimerase/isomerase [Muribaculaceae bacterium]